MNVKIYPRYNFVFFCVELLGRPNFQACLLFLMCLLITSNYGMKFRQVCSVA